MNYNTGFELHNFKVVKTLHTILIKVYFCHSGMEEEHFIVHILPQCKTLDRSCCQQDACCLDPVAAHGWYHYVVISVVSDRKQCVPVYLFLLLTSSYLSRICVTMYDNMLCLFSFRIVLRMRNMNCSCFGLCNIFKVITIDLIQLVNCFHTNTVTPVLRIRITNKQTNKQKPGIFLHYYCPSFRYWGGRNM